MEDKQLKNTSIFKSLITTIFVYASVYVCSWFVMLGVQKILSINQEKLDKIGSDISSFNSKISEARTLLQQEKSNSEEMKKVENKQFFLYGFNFEDLFLISNFFKEKNINAIVKPLSEEKIETKHDEKEINRKEISITYSLVKKDEKSCLDEFYNLELILPGYLYIDSQDFSFDENGVKCNISLKWNLLFLS